MYECRCKHHLVGGFSPIASEDLADGVESGGSLRGGFSNIASEDISEGIESGAGLTINHKKGRPKKGGALSASTLQNVLKSGYKPINDQEKNIDGYVRDDSLSGQRVQTYYNPDTGHAIINHRGTSASGKDWLNNLAYATGLYKYTGRYKNAKDLQAKAEQKYGAKNLTTTGHSQGAMLAEELGKNSKESISLDRPANLSSLMKNKTKKNHYDIRTNNDLVSAMIPLQRKSNKAITIDAGIRNPLGAHDVGQLSKLGNQMIGQGIFKRRTRKIKK